MEKIFIHHWEDPIKFKDYMLSKESKEKILKGEFTFLVYVRGSRYFLSSARINETGIYISEYYTKKSHSLDIFINNYFNNDGSSVYELRKDLTQSLNFISSL